MMLCWFLLLLFSGKVSSAEEICRERMIDARAAGIHCPLPEGQIAPPCKKFVFDPPPADISFLLADIKYNEKQGVKICELQQGNVSLFKGFDYIHQRSGVVGERLCEVLSHYHDQFWFLETGINFPPMKEHMIAHHWRFSRSLIYLLQDAEFGQLCLSPIENPSDIRSYRAVVYAQLLTDWTVAAFKNHYPGALLMDAGNIEYLGDKYQMSTLFLGDERLEKVKPKWKLYPREYHDQLAEQIIHEIGSDLLVIKPTSASEGKGVIIVPKEELDATLKKIILDPLSLREETDRGYKFWGFARNDSFLVEEYIPSDPIYPESLGSKPYNATMRVVFVLVYDKNEVNLHYLGAYWTIPEKSLEEPGTFHEKSKAYVFGTDYYYAVAKETLDVVEEQLREPLILMYKKMLKIKE